MAWRAGCRVSNMEFNQFHPTCLYHPEVKNFLITEAMRGEGAVLKRPTDGSRFMPDFDPRGALAPPDIVASALDHANKRPGLYFVHIELNHKTTDIIPGTFHPILQLLQLG